VIGLGTQDDFAYAEEFISTLGVDTPTMLWDPSFETWRRFGVTTNSQMILLSPDLSQGTELFFGFDEARRDELVRTAAALAA